MLRLSAALVLLAPSLACASSPDLKQLCGTWAVDDMREQWWIDGGGLEGEGRAIQAGVELVFERLTLAPAPGGRRHGHTYAAQVGDADSTAFAPIDPRDARFGPQLAGFPPEVHVFAWANYAHDFPQEIHYVVSANELYAAVSGPGQEQGWTFRRVSACEPGPQR